MRYALVNNEKTEAKSELKGLCLGCGQPMIAKCGDRRMHHWAHASKRNCDSWWETETEWHRSWKNNFPTEWQEIFMPDEQTGEKHVADICTKHNLVIEFQHSHINPQERYSRERFYKNMLWVVDGTRLKRDYPRFIEGAKNLKCTALQGFFFTSFPDECFPKDWLESSVPVIFDFREDPAFANPHDIIRNSLWCLLPGRAEGYALVACISRNDFVERLINYPQLFNVSPNEHIRTFAESIKRQGNYHF